MKVIGIAGWSGSGKTTLIERLIPVLIERGMRVSTIKHAHHQAAIDRDGKDSWRHGQSGAQEVMLVANRGWALMHHGREESAQPKLETLLARMAPVDLVLLEGFKALPIPKVEVWREVTGKPLLAPDDPWIRMIAALGFLPPQDVPVVPLDAIDAIADSISTFVAA